MPPITETEAQSLQLHCNGVTEAIPSLLELRPHPLHWVFVYHHGLQFLHCNTEVSVNECQGAIYFPLLNAAVIITAGLVFNDPLMTGIYHPELFLSFYLHLIFLVRIVQTTAGLVCNDPLKTIITPNVY